MPPNNPDSKRLLFVSNLFPSREDSVRGLDNATLLHAMKSDWAIRVISPRPVFPPWKSARPSPREDDLSFEPVYVPSPYVPKAGGRWNDRLMARALRPVFEKIVGEFQPDAVLCSWLYPDGCAVARLVEDRGLPLVLITQGTDTHHYLDSPVRRRKILSAIETCAAVVCRSGDLARRLEAAGADPGKLNTIYNGVDTAMFRPRDRDSAREELDLEPDAPLFLFVGNLLEVKDPHFLIDALLELNRRRAGPGQSPARLAMIGDGPLRESLESEILHLDICDWFELPGRLPPVEIARWMNAADLLCLSSRSEGFPNVILEAMASGLPVVSTDVGGIHELLDRPDLGRLVPRGDLGKYVEALDESLARTLNAEKPATPAVLPIDPGWERAAREYDRVIESTLKDFPAT